MLLGIDLGTSAAKVMAVTPEGRVLGTGTAGYPLHTPHPGWVEQAPADWWTAVKDATAQCLAQMTAGGNAAVGDIAAIGLSGHMSGLVLVNRDGAPVRPCIMLTDTRSQAQSARLRQTVGKRARALSGNTPMDALLAPKLLWVKEEEPDTYAKAYSFLFPKDYIRFRLTGDFSTEQSDAGNTLFMDSRTGQWDRKLMADMGLDPELAPAAVTSTTITGRLTPEAAAELGLSEGVPVVAGGADMACSAVGIGAVEPGIVSVTIGTAAQVLACVPDIDSQVGGQLTFHPHAEVGTLYALGSIFSGGLATSWLAKALGEEEDLRRDPGAYFEALGRQAAAARPGSGGVVFLPFLVGSGSPFWNPRAQAGWVGLTVSSGRPEMVRSVLEGVAYNIRDSVEVLRLAGAPVKRVHIAGGGAGNAAWRQIIADVLGVPVFQPACRNTSAMGAAALAGIGLGLFRDMRDAVRALVTFSAPVEPNPQATERYNQLYPVYRRIYASLEGAFEDLTRLKD